MRGDMSNYEFGVFYISIHTAGLAALIYMVWDIVRHLVAAIRKSRSKDEKAKKLQATVDEQAKELERLGAIVSELESVKRESKGVAGYHLNGDIATWEEVGL